MTPQRPYPSRHQTELTQPLSRTKQITCRATRPHPALTAIALECDAFVAYPDEWTLQVRVFAPDGSVAACASTFYKDIAGKTGPVLFNCSGDHPTGSGPIYTGDGGSWACPWPASCRDQTGTFTIS